MYGGRVFYVLNPLRKRFNFVKGTDYRKDRTKYRALLQEFDIEIPNTAIKSINNVPSAVKLLKKLLKSKN